jgi:hypothetical protein
VNRHAKASSVGSSTRQAGRLSTVIRGALALALALVAFLGIGASAASAAQIHSFSASFGEAGSGNGQLSLAEHSGLAVNEESGDVYVADTGNGRVQQFEADGTFIRTFSSPTSPTFIAIDNSAGPSNGDIYVADPSRLTATVSKYEADGTPITSWGNSGTITGSPSKPFSDITGIAVDSVGVLYVLGQDGTPTPMFKFSPAGSFIEEFDTALGTSTSGVAIDPAGSIYKVRGSGAIAKLSPAGALEIEEIACGCGGLAVDPSNGNLYAAFGGEVHHFDSTANPLEAFGSGHLSNAVGVAVNAATGTAYVADSAASKIAVFEPISVPDATTQAATEVTRTSATLHGTVSAAGGPDATCVFQYATEAAFAEKGFTEAEEAPCEPAGPFTGPGSEAVSAEVSGLDPGTAYRFRLLATSENGSNPGQALSFSTVGAVNVTTGAASSILATTATLNGTLDPEGIEPEACFFEYGEEESYGQNTPCAESPAEIGNGSGPVAVHADLSGLSTATTYHFRLSATNSFGTSNGADASLKTVGLPSVLTLLAFDRTPESAEVRGELEPNPGTSGLATSYRFEYGTDTSYGHSTPVESSGTVVPPGAEAWPTVSAQITGLSPATLYHYRLIAENAAGTAVPGSDRTFITPFATAPEESCPNEALRSEDGSLALPDCRAYELVSPPGKGKEGGDVMPDNSRSRAAAEGSAVSFASLRSFGDSTGTGQAAEFLSQRSTSSEPGDNGWSTHSISPHQEPSSIGTATSILEPFYIGELSSDLKEGVFGALSPLSEEPLVAEAQNLYTRTDLRSAGSGNYLLDSACPLCAEEDVPLPSSFSVLAKPWLAGASADFSHVLFESTRRLTPESTASLNAVFNLYQSIDGQVSLVGLIPPPGQTDCGPSGPTCVAAASSVTAQGASNNVYAPHVISADGSRTFFTDNSASGGRLGALYVRIDNERTIQINASEKTSPDEPQLAQYADATPDGSRAFFISGEGLVDEDTDGGPDLYMWDASAPAGERLTLLSGEATGNGGVSGMIGSSADGHYVYFLVGFSSPQIYLWHDGAVSRIGSVLPQDLFGNAVTGSEWNLLPLQSRVSPDGRHLIFYARSGVDLSGYASTDECDGATLRAGGSTCQVLYLYDADSNQLQCVSCTPDGSPAEHNATVQVRESYGGTLVTWHLPHALSDNGRYVFFTTGAALVEGDTNGKTDAYEYDSQTEEAHLLSSGTSKDNSYFMDASADGHDAFIATDQQLVGWDVDGNYDLYDVRVVGGFPQPPAVTAPCAGESCRPGSSPGAPTPGSAGSALFSGPGNQVVKRCPKGRHATMVGGKRRCVKPRHHAKRRGAKHKRDAKRNRRAGR